MTDRIRPPRAEVARRRAGWLSLGMLLVGWSFAVPAARAQDTSVLASQEKPTSVSAYGGRAVWSGVDTTSGRYRLASSLNGGPPATLPVAPRSVPFDVDVGPDASGRPVAVYSRCRREPPVGGTRWAQVLLPTYARGRDCDVYEFDFQRGAERPVRGASDPRVSEYLPSVWRHHIVFARIDPRLPVSAEFSHRSSCSIAAHTGGYARCRVGKMGFTAPLIRAST